MDSDKKKVVAVGVATGVIVGAGLLYYLAHKPKQPPPPIPAPPAPPSPPPTAERVCKTSLSLSAPDSISVNQEFTAMGTLLFICGEMSIPPSGETVELYVDEVLVASTTTSAGSYAFNVKILSEGTHRLTARYPGKAVDNEWYEPAVAYKLINVSAAPAPPTAPTPTPTPAPAPAPAPTPAPAPAPTPTPAPAPTPTPTPTAPTPAPAPPTELKLSGVVVGKYVPVPYPQYIWITGTGEYGRWYIYSDYLYNISGDSRVKKGNVLPTWQEAGEGNPGVHSTVKTLLKQQYAPYSSGAPTEVSFSNVTVSLIPGFAHAVSGFNVITTYPGGGQVIRPGTDYSVDKYLYMTRFRVYYRYGYVEPEYGADVPVGCEDFKSLTVEPKDYVTLRKVDACTWEIELTATV